mgnify:FL=1|jgi:predicted negative regulator of RcsB-dependent stress response
MAYDLEEQESIDQMKAWWDQWGTPITAAVCVCCLGFAGWNGWQWYQRNQAAQASGAYVQLQNAIYQNDAKNVKSIADGLIEDYGTTIYAPLGALASAAAEVQEGNLDLARDRLVWVIEKSGHPEYDTIARVRLAGVELSAKKPEAALKVLEPAKPVPDQTALVEDRLGDVYYAMNDFEKARAAWQKAVEAAGEQSPIRGVLHYKLASLPPAAE